VDDRVCAHTRPAQKIDVRQFTVRCDLKHCQHLKTKAARDRATPNDGSKGIDVRTHCFISTTSASARGARWAWHTADDNGVSRVHSNTEFEDFNACVDDARAHGYHHVEVPVLHWSCAHGDAVAEVQCAQPATIEAAAAPVYTLAETQ
jgi:hypothetical protein